MLQLHDLHPIDGQTCADRVTIQQNGYDLVNRHEIVIIPRLNFTCDGRITNIRVRIVPPFFLDISNEYPYIQVWRPSTQMVYDKIGEIQVQRSQLSRPFFFEGNIPLTDSDSILVQSGDVVGFYNPPGTDHYVRTIPTEGYVLYSFAGSIDTMSLNLSNATGSTGRHQPLIQFTFGK